MELWQVRKEYRQLAMRLRRRREPLDEHLEQIEEQVLSALASCDRYETEVAVLKLAMKCARGRLRRLRHWVECSGLLKSVPLSLARKDDEPAADDLVRTLQRKGRETSYLRQLLDELSHLERRLMESRERLSRMTTQGVRSLQLLFTHLSVRSDSSLERLVSGD
jgi:DNA repair exonuclease SbcCD ATPase subunit